MKKGILLHEATDDVGVAVMDLKAGEEIGVATLEGVDVKQVKLVSDVPLGHKVAMADLAKDKHVIEYGRAIGHTLQAVARGEAGINQCPPGGAEGIARLAAIPGRPAHSETRASRSRQPVCSGAWRTAEAATCQASSSLRLSRKASKPSV